MRYMYRTSARHATELVMRGRECACADRTRMRACTCRVSRIAQRSWLVRVSCKYVDHISSCQHLFRSAGSPQTCRSTLEIMLRLFLCEAYHTQMEAVAGVRANCGERDLVRSVRTFVFRCARWTTCCLMTAQCATCRGSR